MNKIKIDYLLSIGLVFSMPIVSYGLSEYIYDSLKVSDVIPTIKNGEYENNKISLKWDTPIPESSVFFL